MNGYIQLPRWLYSHPVMKNALATQCFLVLLYQARIQPGEVFFNGSRIYLEIGESVVSRRELANRLATTPAKVRDALKNLESHGLIRLMTCSNYSVTQIVGFEYYQPATVRPQKDHETTTETRNNSGIDGNLRPQKDREMTTKNKKVNNNINNILYTREFEIFWERYPKKFNKQQTYRNFVKAAKAHGTEAIQKALDVYLAEIDAKGTAADYIIRSTNFVGQKAYFLGYLEQASENDSVISRVEKNDEAEKTRLMLAKMKAEDMAYESETITV